MLMPATAGGGSGADRAMRGAGSFIGISSTQTAFA